MTQYLDFLEQKKKRIIDSGFEVETLPDILFPFQDFIVRKALKKGRYAIFADCGLGKTIMQLVWAQQVNIHTDKPVLILAPLAVVGQTIKEGEKFGIEIKEYPSECSIQITNYEQIDNIDLSVFPGIVLDESSILKNYDGAYKKLLIDLCANIPYKLCCTATPSPNDEIELTNHAEFLGIMKSSEVLATYFVHDGGVSAVKYRIKKHALKDYWTFVASWASMVSLPSDIGFSNEGYILPSLNYEEVKIKTTFIKDGGYFNSQAVSATDFNKELRLTKVERLDEVAKIVNGSDESFIIWINQNEEGELLRKLIPGAIEVSGSDSNEYKKEMLLGFGENKFRVLITKKKVGMFGLNYQNCHNQVFASLDFSFEGLYQAIRRSYRFGQLHPVNIYLVTTDTMANVLDSIKRKQKQFEIMQHSMQQSVNEVFNEEYKSTVEVKEIISDNYTIKRGDSVQLIQSLPDASVGFSIFSPPFVDLFTYSDHIEDMGNSRDYKEFLIAFKFLVSELFRVTKDGRNVAVHCMDLPVQKGKEGYIGLRDFSGMITKTFEDAGFIYHSRVTIWKNPVTEMQRTKALGLLHKQVKKDSTMSRVGIPDYLLVFRKTGENLEPVQCMIDVDTWQKYASPVWMDIDYGDTLNFRGARDEKDEKHICPLQLPTIERAVTLWSNKGDTVFTPFLGIGSEVYQAVKMGRKGIGFELKQSYFDIAAQNCKDAEQQSKMPTIFDL